VLALLPARVLELLLPMRFRLRLRLGCSSPRLLMPLLLVKLPHALPQRFPGFPLVQSCLQSEPS